MNAPLKRFSPILAFLIVCVLSMLLLWLGLRVFFNQDKLASRLTQTFTGAQLHVVAGQAQTDGQLLQVHNTEPQGQSVVSLRDLTVDTRFYERLVIVFADKHQSQPLRLSVYGEQAKALIEQPILYTDNNISRFDITALAPSGGVMTAVDLTTSVLIEPYRVKALRFEPKIINNTLFAQLLWNGFSFKPQQDSHPLGRHFMSDSVVIMTPKMLLLLYFAIVAVLFALFLLLAGRAAVSAWWAMLISAWLVLDIHYLAGETRLAKGLFAAAQQADSERLFSTNMSSIIALLAVLISAWVLGFVIIRGLLKQRYGYQAFALGAGYLLGCCLVILAAQAYRYWQRPIVWYEMVAMAWLLALPILLIWRAKRCSIEELRLEKAPSNASYVAIAGLLVLLLYRWGITGFEIFISQANANEKTTVLFSHHLATLMAPLQHNSLALGGGNANAMVGLAWLGNSIALLLLLVGGLRYLGARLLPSVLGAYAALTLPMFDIHTGVFASTEVWAAAGLAAVFFAVAIVLVYQEFRLLVLGLIMGGAIYYTQEQVVFFFVAILPVIFWRLVGGALTALLLMASMVSTVLFYPTLLSDDLFMFNSLLTGVDETIALSTIADLLNEEWFRKDNWHFVFFAAVGSLLLAVMLPCNRDRQGIALILASGVSMVVVMLAVLCFSHWPAGTLAERVNRLTLYFVPMVALIPVCVYHLVTRDDETLPPI